METSDRLRQAIIDGRVQTVELIIERHPKLLKNTDTNNGWTSLHYAAFHGQYEICKLLINKGHDKLEVSLSHDRSTALHLAALRNRERSPHYLAQHLERSIDWKNEDHETALMVSVAHGNDPCVNLLLDFGADIELGDESGTRPLHVAAARGHVKTLRTLIDRGADANKPNFQGWTPADYSATVQVQTYLHTLINDIKRNHNSATPIATSPVGSPPHTSSEQLT